MKIKIVFSVMVVCACCGLAFAKPIPVPTPVVTGQPVADLSEPRSLESGDLTSETRPSGGVFVEPIVDLLPEVQQAIDDVLAQSRGNVLQVECNGAFGYSTIQSAINAATDGDTVVVYPRNFASISCTGDAYVENINFLGKAITVQGLIPTSPDYVDHTIVDGSQPADPAQGSVVTFNHQEGNGSLLDGLTLTKGIGFNPYGPGYNTRRGGGIFCSNSAPTIRHCAIINNTSGPDYTVWNGGGIYINSAQGRTPSVGHCVITDNVGEGIFISGCSTTITQCTISRNSTGGIISSHTVSPAGCHN